MMVRPSSGLSDDADSNLPGHQVPVTVGGTTWVSVLVDAEDGVAERWYRIEVARASNQERGWRVYDDVLAEDVIDDLDFAPISWQGFGLTMIVS